MCSVTVTSACPECSRLQKLDAAQHHPSCRPSFGDHGKQHETVAAPRHSRPDAAYQFVSASCLCMLHSTASFLSLRPRACSSSYRRSIFSVRSQIGSLRRMARNSFAQTKTCAMKRADVSSGVSDNYCACMSSQWASAPKRRSNWASGSRNMDVLD